MAKLEPISETVESTMPSVLVESPAPLFGPKNAECSKWSLAVLRTLTLAAIVVNIALNLAFIILAIEQLIQGQRLERLRTLMSNTLVPRATDNIITIVLSSMALIITSATTLWVVKVNKDNVEDIVVW